MSGFDMPEARAISRDVSPCARDFEEGQVLTLAVRRRLYEIG
jgi:hypothetical protein